MAWCPRLNKNGYNKEGNWVPEITFFLLSDYKCDLTSCLVLFSCPAHKRDSTLKTGTQTASPLNVLCQIFCRICEKSNIPVMPSNVSENTQVSEHIYIRGHKASWCLQTLCSHSHGYVCSSCQWLELLRRLCTISYVCFNQCAMKVYQISPTSPLYLAAGLHQRGTAAHLHFNSEELG